MGTSKSQSRQRQLPARRGELTRRNQDHPPHPPTTPPFLFPKNRGKGRKDSSCLMRMMMAMGRLSIPICKSAAEASDGAVWPAVTGGNRRGWTVMQMGEFGRLNQQERPSPRTLSGRFQVSLLQLGGGGAIAEGGVRPRGGGGEGGAFPGGKSLSGSR